MNAKKLILENRKGQAVRFLDWTESQIEIVYRKDTRRVEAHSDCKEFLALNIPFESLLKLSTSKITSSGVQIPGFGVLRSAQDSDILSPSVAWVEEETLDMKKVTKWTAIAHLSVILLIMLLAWIFKPAAKLEEQIVLITPQNRIETPPKQTVKMSEKKIKKIPPKTKARVANRTTRPKTTQMRTSKQPTKRVVVQRPKDVSNMGALGALGGTRTGSAKSAGLNMSASNNSAGSGKSGWGGAGGIDSSVKGKGIIASQIGVGGKAEGAGGYGTRGKGGGRTGYGNTQFAGSSGGYTLPLEEEALIQGGLDRDQIAAVINRNIGQIIYCYEQGLQSKPALAGRVTMGFVIGGNGSVRTANVANTSLKSAQVENCITQKLKAWKFPKPEGQVDVRVSYPFVLKRVGQG